MLTVLTKLSIRVEHISTYKYISLNFTNVSVLYIFNNNEPKLKGDKFYNTKQKQTVLTFLTWYDVYAEQKKSHWCSVEHNVWDYCLKLRNIFTNYQEYYRRAVSNLNYCVIPCSVIVYTILCKVYHSHPVLVTNS